MLGIHLILRLKIKALHFIGDNFLILPESESKLSREIGLSLYLIISPKILRENLIHNLLVPPSAGSEFLPSIKIVVFDVGYFIPYIHRVESFIGLLSWPDYITGNIATSFLLNTVCPLRIGFKNFTNTADRGIIL
ncbi:hypothetical protein C5C07_14565 [Haloferax sp. Atlit-4N]|nr:hypothetical protein C5C07_14565 [Haloferax sp. Atlit-4N]